MSMRPPEPSPVAMRPLPASAAELRERLSEPRPFSPPLQLTLRPRDVVIATFPKCGTTWMQQIVHGLRTGGSMDFEEISLVVPWIDAAALMQVDLEAPQVAEPRAFKTHLPWAHAPRGSRYIYVTREPADALVSFFHFMNGSLCARDTVSLDDFGVITFLERPTFGLYWEHLRGWWAQRGRADILFVAFEHLKQDLAAQVRRVASFLGMQPDPALLALVTEQASFEFMRQRPRQFDDNQVREAIARQRRSIAEHAPKVRAGQVGQGMQSLSPAVRALLDAEWQRRIGEPLGIPSYQDLLARIAADSGAV